MTLSVALVTPEREIWSGNANRVIAKTLEGDIGILTGHAPVFGVLATGSLIRVLDTNGDEIFAAISSGFLSVADDRISVLAQQAQLGSDVDVGEVRSQLGSLGAESQPSDAEESARAAYAQALLRAAGEAT